MSLADKTLATKLRDICFERKRKGRVSARRRGDRNKKYRFARFPRRDRTKTRRAGSSRHRIDPRLSVDFLDKYQIFARRIYNIIFKRFPEKRTGNGMSEYCSGTNFTGSPGILANVTGVPANTRVSKSTIARRVVLVSRARVKNLIRINK